MKIGGDMIILFALLIVVIAVLLFEYFLHRRALHSIKVRIHVNGTRGKSSVTRLIAAALKEHGIFTFAKTTGTLPRLILPDGTEYPVYRPSKANIIEQLRIISLAASQGAEALVIECMALQPMLQSLSELKIVSATHGVITNARADHLDVMGPNEVNVAEALLGTTPLNAKLYTCERDYPELFQNACDDRDTELITITVDDTLAVSDEEMSHFEYVEHKENVALALKVTADLGVPRETALRGMYQVKADVGALYEYYLSYFGRSLTFINGFAANDPESTEMIWNMALKKYAHVERKVMIINSRADRPDRSQQLGKSIHQWSPADHYVLVGTGAYMLLRVAVDSGIPSSKMIFAERMNVSQIFEELLSITQGPTLMMGVGNIKGPGLELIQFFKNRATSQPL